MSRALMALAALALLGACGVAGSPTRPEPRETPGARVSVDSYVGYDTKHGMLQRARLGLHLGG